MKATRASNPHCLIYIYTVSLLSIACCFALVVVFKFRLNRKEMFKETFELFLGQKNTQSKTINIRFVFLLSPSPTLKECFPDLHTVLTESGSSCSCIVMQSMLIWMVFPADLSMGLSVKFSSMGWTEWTADLKHHVICWGREVQYKGVSLVCDVAFTHWSSISSNWLKKSWLKCSELCDDWFWDMLLKKGLSLQGKREEGSLSLQTIDRITFISGQPSTHFNGVLGGKYNQVKKCAMSAHIRNSCGCFGLKCGHPVCGWKQEEEEPCWQPFIKSTSIVKESACIMWNICTTHNGDYAPFRQRHFDLLPWNITPAAQLGLPLFLLKWRTLQCEAAGIPPRVYMIALLRLLVCVQLDGPGVERVDAMG